MHAYIAFNAQDKSCVEAWRQIPCKAFAPPGKYVPLMDSKFRALDQAISANTSSATATLAAREPTMWFILEVAISDV